MPAQANSRRGASRGVPPTSGSIDGLLQFRIGTDLLIEFVAGHDASDVLRELVQNEYDAGGSSLAVEFGPHELRVTGNGRSIDGPGWRRLSVMMSTGLVAGGAVGEGRVAKKVNGIGSKNLGLRTLFLFGDRIEVRSGGRMTVMDVLQGTLPAPILDTDFRQPVGVEIRVPYRERAVGPLQPFTLEREMTALDAFASGFSAVLSKLLLPGGNGKLSRVRVTSQRAERQISWTQTAESFRVGVAGVRGIRRRIRRYDEASGHATRRSERIELEFERLVPLPKELEMAQVPGFYKTGGRIRVSVSVTARGQSVDTDEPGRFYYPLRVPNGTTGTSISICAPFLMKEDRSALLDIPANATLQEAAAELAADLISTDWLQRFGRSAYHALAPRDDGSKFSAAIASFLKTRAIWPTAGRIEDRRTRFRLASGLVLPSAPELGGILDDDRYLDASVASDTVVVRLARDAGAKPFTLSSLIRLRCAGEDESVLRTKLGPDEANFHYTNFAAAYKGPVGIRRQTQMAIAINARARHLTAPNKYDIAETATTLAADGSLAAPKDLWFVPGDSVGVEIPLSERLHPGLADARQLAKLCKRFEPNLWVARVCDSARTGDASDAARSAVAQYVRARHGKFPAQLLAAIRRSPVLTDHRGRWVAASDLVSRRIPGAVLLEPVLHFPSDLDAKDPALVRRLRIRAKLRGSDLAAFARFVDEGSQQQFERLLDGQRRFLSPKVVAALGGAAILESSQGGLAQPANLYIDGTALRTLLGPTAAFVVGRRFDLYRRLKVMTDPRSVDLLSHLDSLKRSDKSPPSGIYPALVDALLAEGKKPLELANVATVWTERGWHAPAEVLVGSRIPESLASLPCVRGPELTCEALVRLGASRAPRAPHWTALFRLIAAKHAPGARVSLEDRRVLRDAYRRLGDPSALNLGLSESDRFLLSNARTLHSRADVVAGRFVINDDPTLAKAASAVGASVAIADDAESSQIFFRTLGARTLTSVAGRGRGRFGAPGTLPPSVHVDQVLRQLHQLEFSEAVAAITRQESRELAHVEVPTSITLHRRLRRLEGLRGATSIEAEFSIGTARITVPRSYWLEDNAIVFANLSSKEDFTGALASAVAEIVGVPRQVQGHLADSIYRILGRGAASISDYLLRRGIPWSRTKRGRAVDRDAVDDAEEAIHHALEAALNTPDKAPRSTPGVPAGASGPSSTPKEPVPLPPIEEVELSIVEPHEGWRPPERSPGGGGGGGGQWTPPSPEDTRRDHEVGRRAEEIVLRAEKQRVADRGQDPERVVWVSDQDPGADFDIATIDEDGETLWFEVKGTTGTDGRFHWPTPQAALAMRHRQRYVLWRVYNATSARPVARPFVDPIGLLGKGALKVDVTNLGAEVEPLGKGQP